MTSQGESDYLDNSSDVERFRTKIIWSFFLSYSPLIISVCVFFLGSWYPTILQDNVATLWAAVLTFIALEFVKSEISRVKSTRLLNRVSEQVIPDTFTGSFVDMFGKARIEKPTIRRVRVFALSSIKIEGQLSGLWVNNVANSVELLLVNAKTYIAHPTPIRDFDDELRNAVTWCWVSRVKENRIQKLKVRQYDFMPTEWFVLFDDELAICGSYVVDEANIAYAKTYDSVFLFRNSGIGAVMISALSKKFDELFKICDNNFGKNEFSGEIDHSMALKPGNWPKINSTNNSATNFGSESTEISIAVAPNERTSTKSES